jgi:hypothetical protein
MPGTFVIDTGRTFAAALIMASAPKLKFGTSEQDISASGERKWEIQAAVTFMAEHGMRPVSEVVSVTVLGGTDPATGIVPGTPVEFENFRVGISTPEARANGRGIMGGKPWYQASGVRAMHGANGRQPVPAGKSD